MRWCFRAWFGTVAVIGSNGLLIDIAGVDCCSIVKLKSLNLRHCVCCEDLRSCPAHLRPRSNTEGCLRARVAASAVRVARPLDFRRPAAGFYFEGPFSAVSTNYFPVDNPQRDIRSML